MGKSTYQITKFIEQYNFKSNIDWEGVSSTCRLKLDINIDEIEPNISPDGITFADFFDWYNNGFGSGDIACYNGNLVMIGICGIDTAKIEATLVGDKIDCSRSVTEASNLSKPSDEDVVLFKKALASNDLQFEESRQLVAQRRIPGTNERISFKKDDDTYGIGVIRSVSKENDTFELYCYYIYRAGTVKYSMHEIISPLSDYTFQVMSRSERNRLKNELKKVGKNWNDKLHRIEPINGKANVGEKYWYINDKMKMVNDTEEGKQTSHFRFIAGNYFLNQDDCLDNLGAINEILRDFLAH